MALSYQKCSLHLLIYIISNNTSNNTKLDLGDIQENSELLMSHLSDILVNIYGSKTLKSN